MSKHIKLSTDIQNIINIYLLPSNFIIKYLKNTIHEYLKEYYIAPIFCAIEFKFICNDAGKYSSCNNINNLKYKFINNTESFWTMRLK